MAALPPAEARPRPRLPEWLRTRLPTTDRFAHTRALLDELKLHTVCQSAMCPNHWECWSKGTATFMIAGDRCTRACGFCAVHTAKPFAAGSRRTGARRRSHPAHAAAPRGHHRGRPRRPGRRRGGPFPAHHRGGARAQPRDRHRGADAGLQRPGGIHRCRAVGPPAHFQPQPGDRAATHARGAFARNLRPFTERAGPGEGAGRRQRLHQVRPDAGPGRNGSRVVDGAGRFAPRGVRHSDARPIPAADAQAPGRWWSLSGRRSSRHTASERGKWAFSTWPAPRWSAAPTMRTNSSVSGAATAGSS